jgi:hypothetical protein
VRPGEGLLAPWDDMPPDARRSLSNAGDHVAVKRWKGIPYSHHGLLLGDGSVVHYTKGGHVKGHVQVTGFRDFATPDDHVYRIEMATHRLRISPGFSCLMACRTVGLGKYFLPRRNCEHVVTWAHTGLDRSTQVRRAVRQVAGGVLGGLMYLIPDTAIHNVRQQTGRMRPRRVLDRPEPIPFYLGDLFLLSNGSWTTRLKLRSRPSTTAAAFRVGSLNSSLYTEPPQHRWVGGLPWEPAFRTPQEPQVGGPADATLWSDERFRLWIRLESSLQWFEVLTVSASRYLRYLPPFPKRFGRLPPLRRLDEELLATTPP